ncbi:MAG: excinuclease ABC subunit UvrC [Verrucomicrobium sp.]|nr:excinuclease ABC subunit UvrC [Verrucomicrobium sp.]
MAATPLEEKLRTLPHRPGVYLYKDRLDRVIYVGKARDLHRRVSQYFHPSRRDYADRKTRALVDAICDLEYHVVKSEPEALLLESKLIKEYRPRYNISFRDDKRFLLVKVNLNDPYPRFQLTRTRREDGSRYFGPFPHSTSLRNSLNLIRRQFKLRTCSPVVPGEADFRHCLDHVIRNCSAPCIHKITRAAYLAQVKQACDFLEGQSTEMLAKLEQERDAAAARLDFEKAAQIRDLLEDLRRTTKPVKRFLRAFNGRALNPQQDMEALGAELNLAEPPRLMECFDISNISTTHKVASMVVFRDGKADRSGYRRYRIRSVEGQDDFASIAEAVRRRYGRVLRENLRQPGLIIVDGGKGQVSAAAAELRALGLENLPLIGLAKENEEIYRPGISEPLVLDKSTGALKLLQRIRDEAHRFANAYHSILLKQRMTESLLDDCPGVSAARKKALLLHFGSVDRLRRATPEEIGEVEGVGPKLAEGIAAYFVRLDRREDAEEIAEEEV